MHEDDYDHDKDDTVFLQFPVFDNRPIVSSELTAAKWCDAV